MHYRRFEIILPFPVLPSGYSNHNIRHAGNTAHSRRHRQHKTGLKRLEILKLEAPPHHFMVRRSFIEAVPNARYLSIPEAIVAYFKVASLHSSWTSEVTQKTQAAVWIKTNQTGIQVGYLSTENCRYIALLYRGCARGGTSCMCYSSTGARFCRSRLASLQRVPRHWRAPGCSKTISDYCIISHFGPCAFRGSPEKQRLIQPRNFHIRDTAGLILKLSSTPVTTTHVLPASNNNYSIFNIIQYYSSECIYWFLLSIRKNPLFI